jgi:hypothetical protein
MTNRGWQRLSDTRRRLSVQLGPRRALGAIFARSCGDVGFCDPSRSRLGNSGEFGLPENPHRATSTTNSNSMRRRLCARTASNALLLRG